MLSARQWRLLELVDGRRSVATVIEAARRDPLDVAADMLALIRQRIVQTVNDTRFLGAIVLRRLSAARRPATARPPGRLGAHVLRQTDGQRNLRDIIDAVGCSDADLIAVVRELVREAWVDIKSGHETFDRFVGA